MKQSSISLDSETIRKLQTISELSHISQVNILREWINLVYGLVGDANRISLLSYDTHKNDVIVTRIAKLEIGLGERT